MDHEDPDAAPSPSLWRNRAYLLLMTGKTTQLVGSGAAGFAVPLVAFAVTGSVFVAGLIGAVGDIGLLLATLPGGVIADRVDRRRLILWCSAAGVVVWGSLALTAVAGLLSGWQLAITLFLGYAVSACYNPADAAAIRRVVTTAQLGSAMAAMQGRGAVASLLASPVGGALYGLSRALPFVASVVGYVVAGAAALFVRRPLNADRSDAPPQSALRSLAEGIRYFGSIPFMRASFVAVAIINLGFTGVIVTLNLHLVSIHTAPLLIALVDVAAGVAMVVGALFAPLLVGRFAAGPLAIVGLVPSVIAGFGMSLTEQYPLYLVWTVVMTVLIPSVNSAVLGYAAAITPDAIQARMNAVMTMSSLAVTPLAPFVAGWLLSGVGVEWCMAVFAVLLLMSVVLIALTPSVRRIGTPDTWEADLIAWPPAGADVPDDGGATEPGS